MVTGHFALAAGVKSRDPLVPLWALMLATQLMDVIFVPLYLLGIETIVPVGRGGYGGGIIHANFTHSLVGALALAAVAWLVGSRFWTARGGLVLGAVTFSHWLLDLLVHRADLPLLPGNMGNLPTLGLSIWQYPLLSAAIELGMIVIGTSLYGVSLWKAAGKGKPFATAAAISLMGIFLTACLAADLFGIG